MHTRLNPMGTTAAHRQVRAPSAASPQPERLTARAARSARAYARRRVLFGATLGVSAGLGVETNASGVHIGGGPGPGAQGQEQRTVSVSKPNVTTGRTANASQRRRKQEATFVCPVPGCGSTFTRSFNLKGHGFARQHDCKRHEQLHKNYRAFNCEGCGKQFARMDALNRHLKSEGGAECMKLQEGGGTPSPPPSPRSNKSQSQPNTATSSSSSSASSPRAPFPSLLYTSVRPSRWPFLYRCTCIRPSWAWPLDTGYMTNDSTM
ncbi:putative zinc finger, C2H2 type [Lyophyllum shimeji]|uniref:Zinc finger, C2H2 type n=1 Tax=Lyophyllum shimeji TaxID=47721 RepID=A0A9P3PFD5_LYOSH|nr:putative zinc finger, C2H2 type [Lyophyllum shimeji]